MSEELHVLGARDQCDDTLSMASLPCEVRSETGRLGGPVMGFTEVAGAGGSRAELLGRLDGTALLREVRPNRVQGMMVAEAHAKTVDQGEADPRPVDHRRRDRPV